MRVWVIATFLLAVGLAGCSGDSGGSGAEPEDEFRDLGVSATEDTGVIRGVVVDEAIRPVAGATVTVLVPEGEPLVKETGEQGIFGFDGLAPGDYFVTVEKLGYFKVQQSVAVQAGVSDPPATRLLLTRDAENFPYYTVQTFQGYIECSTRGNVPGVVSAGLNACENVGNQETSFVHAFDALPSLVQAEMTWESTQSTGSGLSLVAGPQTCEDIKWARSDGSSPRVLRMNETTLEGQADAGGTEATCYRVFAWTADDSGGTAGATVSQEFQIIVHTFYNYLPPEDWTFTNDGAPPSP